MRLNSEAVLAHHVVDGRRRRRRARDRRAKPDSSPMRYRAIGQRSADTWNRVGTWQRPPDLRRARHGLRRGRGEGDGVCEGSAMDEVGRSRAPRGTVGVVTGGTSGIGLAVVRRFVDAGAEVVALARRERPEVGAGGRVGSIACDVADAGRRPSARSTRRSSGGRTARRRRAERRDQRARRTVRLDGDGCRRRSGAMFEVNTMGVFHGLASGGGRRCATAAA